MINFSCDILELLPELVKSFCYTFLRYCYMIVVPKFVGYKHIMFVKRINKLLQAFHLSL